MKTKVITLASMLVFAFSTTAFADGETGVGNLTTGETGVGNLVIQIVNAILVVVPGP